MYKIQIIKLVETTKAAIITAQSIQKSLTKVNSSTMNVIEDSNLLIIQ